MKNLIVICLLLICNLNFAQNFQWVTTTSSLNSNNMISIVNTTDVNGNIYTVGREYGGNYLVQKMNTYSGLVWIKYFDTNENFGSGVFITYDNNGNLILTGEFTSTLDLDPGPGIFNVTSNGQKDIFILKLDTAGNFIWGKSIGNGLNCFPTSITSDSNGSPIIVGYFSNVLDLDPGIGVFNLTSSGFGNSLFLLKLDSLGNFNWAKTIIGNGDYSTCKVTIDVFDNIFLFGNFKGTKDFDPGIGVFNMTAISVVSLLTEDMFTVKLNPNGDFIWAKSVIGSGAVPKVLCATDLYGNQYYSGYYINKLDFDPGPNVFLDSAVYNDDIFILKLDTAGNFVWFRTFKNNYDQEATSITTDSYGNIYCGGFYRDSIDFNPGLGLNYLKSKSNNEHFILKLSQNGDFIWVNSLIGSGLGKSSFSVTTDSIGNLFANGTFTDTTDFDPGNPVYNVSTNTQYVADLFTLKLRYDSCSNFYFRIDTISLLNCFDSAFAVVHPINGIPPYSYLWNTYPPTNDSIASFDTTGIFNVTVSDGNGCIKSSSIEIKKQYINSSKNLKICQGDSIFLGGNFQYNPGVYIDTILSPLSCDSIVTSYLTFGESTDTFSITTCSPFLSPSGNYIWTINGTYYDTIPNYLGCDSIITFNLTFGSTSYDTITVSSCGSYISPSNNNIWFNSGIYLDTLFGNYGCNTVTTINLTITPVINFPSFTFINNGNGNYSFTNTSSGSYNQINWAFGDGNTSLTNNPIHTFSTNGIYVVVLTINDSIYGGSCFNFFKDTISVTAIANPLQCNAGFVMYPDTLTGNITVVNSSTGINLSYLWDFGDGNTSNLPNPTHTYSSLGPFYLCLTIDDGNTCIDAYCDSIGKNGVVFKASGFTINVIAQPIISGMDNNLESNSDLEIYPNPTSSQLFIYTKKLNLSEIKIIDLTGKIISTTTKELKVINVDDLSPGIYFIELSTKNGVITKKFIKQ